MTKVHVIIALATSLSALLAAVAANARDGQRQPVPVGQTPPTAIPNPYAAPATGNRAADAYSMGFAIGLGTALINKQREDELKRQQLEQAKQR